MKHPIQHNPSFETIQKSSMWSLKKGWTLVRVSVTVKCEGFREAVVLGRSLTEGSPVLPVIYFRIFVILCACVCVWGGGWGVVVVKGQDENSDGYACVYRML